MLVGAGRRFNVINREISFITMVAVFNHIVYIIFSDFLFRDFNSTSCFSLFCNHKFLVRNFVLGVPNYTNINPITDTFPSVGLSASHTLLSHKRRNYSHIKIPIWKWIIGYRLHYEPYQTILPSFRVL